MGVEIATRQRLFRYFTAGTIACFANFSLLTIMIELGHVNANLSSWCAFTFGAGVNYLLQYYWTFQTNTKHLVTLAKFIVVVGLTSIINTIIFWFSHHILGIWFILSQLIALICVIPMNYQVHKRFTYK